MPNPPFFYSGDAFSDSFFFVAIRFPHSQENWVYSTFLGAIYNMGEDDAWVSNGETTASEAASIFRDIFNNRITGMPWDIGDIKFTGAPPITGSVWLLCDGSLLDSAAFPELFAAIGTEFNTGGEPAGGFRVPDLRGRVAVMTNNSSGRLPSWADAPGGSGGESAHQLTVPELAAHSHTDTGHFHTDNQNSLLGAAVVPGEGPVLIPNPLPNVTGTASASITNTGGDEAHNNVQPSLALACYILAKF